MVSVEINVCFTYQIKNCVTHLKYANSNIYVNAINPFTSNYINIHMKSCKEKLRNTYRWL